jgi:ABC-type transporter Mla MlaB component
MLRIEATRETDDDRTIALTGTIGGEYLPELEDAMQRAAGDRHRLSFDLSQVRLVDREAVRFLASAVERHVRLVGCPAYLREWVRSESRARQAGSVPNQRQAGSVRNQRQAGSLSYCEHEDNS